MGKPKLIAVCSSGTSPDSLVEPVVGRADYFHLVDIQTDQRDILPNSFRDLQEGCGIHVAQALSAKHVDAILAGNCGPKAARALREAGIQVVYPFSGTVTEAVQAFIESLHEMNS
ncbi:NifB/NifX family molybdenum-iron cluster-binding protein [Desulfobaculum bizertense]|uniref:Predicted Fe-Mo cluster-binding protein, NifX family n=1 Tax=Desulfobaculum bizertense DSM 18034 TaxID=1121442 RepID=A0A1T4WQW1_9BACT|nr:NifB/NifX family molybdenum-iron cluster-binding protein [Desulfobaculum bizertense]UIJ37292.1 dinitrogenase iron-molybdenum cofactor biosynthesis protein [Desulfobaculum bizertense]SKA79762.1 Predicted Fe-Mo cluster-binding protein, NifX family [Desulfobaculum bizertense DSM 18034]